MAKEPNFIHRDTTIGVSSLASLDCKHKFVKMDPVLGSQLRDLMQVELEIGHNEQNS